MTQSMDNMDEWMNGRATQSMDNGMRQWMDDWMDGRTTQSMDNGMRQWMKGVMNDTIHG